MGALESCPSTITVIKPFKKLIIYIKNQNLSNETIKTNLDLLTKEADQFFRFYSIVAGTKIDKNISPYFTKIEKAVNSFQKCAKYIFTNKKSKNIMSIKTNFQKDFASFVRQLTKFAKYTTTILQALQKLSSPALFERFYIELSIFDFALTVQNTEKPPYYQLSTLPSYSLHDQVLKTTQKCLNIIGPHECGKTTLIPMFLACRSLSQSIKSKFIILIENNPSLVHGIEECFKRLKKKKNAKINNDDDDHHLEKESDDDDDDDEKEDEDYKDFGGEGSDEDDDEEDDECLFVTSSLQKVIEMLAMKPMIYTVIAILSPLETLQLVHITKDIFEKAIFIVDDVHQRTIETDVLFQDITRNVDRLETRKKAAKITMMAPVADSHFLNFIRHYENFELNSTIAKPAKKIEKTYDSIERIGKIELIKEMCNFFDKWIDEDEISLGSVIVFVPKAKTGKKILKTLYKKYSKENSLIIIPLRTKIRKGEALEPFFERLNNDIDTELIARTENPEMAAEKTGGDFKNQLFLLPIDLTNNITEEERNFVESRLPLPFIQKNLVRLIITTGEYNSFSHIPDLTVIFDSGLTETEYYDIEKGVSIYKEELLPTPYIDERHELLGEGKNKIHFVFEVKNIKRPKNILPAVKRCNMVQSILRLRSIDINLEDQRNLPNEPNHTILEAGVDLLKRIGIINSESRELTDIGKIAAKFSSVSPFLALATAKFVEKQEFAFLVSLIIERIADLIEDNNAQLLYDHFEPESDVVTILESILALNIDDAGHLIDENNVKYENSGFSIGSLFSIYTSIANTFEKDGRNEGRETVVDAIKWAHEQPGGTLGMVDKYVNLLDQKNFLDLRKGVFEYIVGAGPGCEPTLVYKAYENLKFDKDKDAQVKFSQRPGWLGLQSPGNIIILSFQIEESAKLNRGLIIHHDPTQIGINPGVVSLLEENPSLNSYFFTALFEAYWSGQPTVNNFIGIYHSHKPKKEMAFLINIRETNKRTYVNYCPKNAAVKNEMIDIIPKLSRLMPFVPRSIVVKSEVPLCAIEVITSGSSQEYETNLFIINNPAKKPPLAYPITKALLDYANGKINDLRQTHPLIRFAITGESAYYKINDERQEDIDFSYPNADPNISSVFDPQHPSHLVFLVNNDYPNKPEAVPQIPWLPPAGAGTGIIESNDANEIKLMIDASTKIMNGLGYVQRSDDFFFITLDGGFPRSEDGEIPVSIQKQVGFDPSQEGAIKQGVNRLVYEFTRIFKKEQYLENPITMKKLGSTSNCKRYETEEAKQNALNQINATLIAQFHLTNDDIQSSFFGPSLICVSISKLPENLTQHPKQADIFKKDYMQCPADVIVSNALKGIGIPVTIVTHEPTITVTVMNYHRLRLNHDQFEAKFKSISNDFGFLLATKPQYFEGGHDLESEKRGVLGEISIDLIGKSTCVAFATSVSNEFLVSSMNEFGTVKTITNTMATMITMRTMRELDPSLGPSPKINLITQKAFRVPHGEIEAMKDLVKRNDGWKFDEEFRVLIVPFEDDELAKKLMLECKQGNLDNTCFYACAYDEPVLLPQLIYANEKDGTVHPYGICKGCTMSIFENDDDINTIFDPITRQIDQNKLKNINQPLSGITLIEDNIDKETGLKWPQIPFGQIIWALMSDINDELTPFIKAWFTIIVEYTIQRSNNFIFCPNHSDVPIPVPPAGTNAKCPLCNMMFCNKCDIWHDMDQPCTGDDLDPSIKRCPNCKLPSFKVSGCNRITCPRCNQSWCYQCGQLCGTVQATYDHIRAMGHYA